jgi:EmrB/QacA subfamily drug resistance transporter
VAEDYSKYKRKSLLITGLGTFMGTLDSSIVNVSLPTISRDLSTTVDMVGWVVLAYSMALFSLLMFFGAVSEKRGFQFSYKYGFSIFLLGSVLSGLSSHIFMLIISRVIQGTGAAMLVSVGPALITRSFPASERGRGLSIISMVVSTGLMLGPPLGGFIIALAGWRWIFFVNVPVCILGVYFTHRYIGDFPISDPNKKISIPGAASLSIGLLLMMISFLLYSRQLLQLPLMIGLLAVSGGFFVSFFLFESNPRTRLIGIDIFRNRTFTFSGTAMLLVFIALISVTILMPFYLEQVKNFDPEHVGFFLMIIPVCIFILAPAAGYLADRLQARLISSSGIIAMTIGIFLISRLNPDASIPRIALSLATVGIGMAFFGTPNTSSIMGSVKRIQLGSASGILATIRTLGISLGVGISVAIFSFFRNQKQMAAADDTISFIYGYHSVYHVMMFVIIIALIFSMSRGRNLGAGKGSEP